MSENFIKIYFKKCVFKYKECQREYKILYVHKLYLRTMLVHCTVYICNVCTIRMYNESALNYQSLKLKTGYRYENQFWNPGFTKGVRQFCEYQYFCFDQFFYLVSPYSPSLNSKSTQMLRPQK